MSNTNGQGEHGNSERKVTSLRVLPHAIEPPRDLWAGIEAAIGGHPDHAATALRLERARAASLLCRRPLSLHPPSGSDH
jgi:hypothetical protein